MIRLMIFDMDGTLLKTEELKAISYARAAVALCPYTLSEEVVVDAFREVVGRSRNDVAQFLVEKFNLYACATELMDQYGVATTWQAYVQLRLEIYENMLADPNILTNSQWQHNVELLESSRKAGCMKALATMSHCEQVNFILQTLMWSDNFDFVATRDDVEFPKPNPEIYLLVANHLNVSPSECLVIEDSAVGVEAAINASMNVVAVSTPFTIHQLHKSNLLDDEWIVDDPTNLIDIGERKFELMAR